VWSITIWVAIADAPSGLCKGNVLNFEGPGEVP
jgi:hypothetical protein